MKEFYCVNKDGIEVGMVRGETYLTAMQTAINKLKIKDLSHLHPVNIGWDSRKCATCIEFLKKRH